MLEAAHPAFADGDSRAAVSVPRDMAGLRAAVHHRPIGRQLWAAPPVPVVTVNDPNRAITAAAARSSAAQVSLVHQPFSAAVATAQPESPAAALRLRATIWSANNGNCQER